MERWPSGSAAAASEVTTVSTAANVPSTFHAEISTTTTTKTTTTITTPATTITSQDLHQALREFWFGLVWYGIVW